jgi:hypothetical protein
MRFKLQFHCDNAAFDEHAPGEVARVLRSLADRIEPRADLPELVHLFDLNGNCIGAAVTTGRRNTKRGA